MGNYLASIANRSAYPQEYERYDTQYGGIKEAIGWTWYDQNTYTSTVTTALAYFNVLRATLNLSNMEVAGSLAAPKAFFLRAIRVRPMLPNQALTAAATGVVQTGAIDDMHQLVEHGVLQLTIGQKIYGIWPLWMLPAGGGVVCFEQTGDIDVVIQYPNNGIADPRCVYSLTKPLFIAPQINFRVDLLWPAGALTLAATGGVCNIWVGLDGDLVRPVQ